MISTLDQIVLRSYTIKAGEYNILYFPFNGIFEHILSQCKIFSKFMYHTENILYEWSAGWPENFNQYKSVGMLPTVRIDAVMVNGRSAMLKAKVVSEALHCPLIMIDHEFPGSSTKSQAIKYLNENIPDETIFVAGHDNLKKSWLYDECEYEVKPYGFRDQGLDKDIEALVMGDYHIDDYDLVELMKNSHPYVETIGNNPNTDKYKSFAELEDKISRAGITISACQPTKTPFLEMIAAASGALIITNRTQWTQSIFKDNETALFYNDPEEIKNLCQIDEEKRINIAENAKNLMRSEYGIDSFCKSWERLFDFLKNRTYVR